MKIFFAISLLLGLVAVGGESFFRADDRWLLTGDSITQTDTYRQVVERVMRHYHPDNGLTFPNRSVWGVPSAHQADAEDKPTVVSIMTGMNDIIHHEYAHETDFTAKAEAYYRNILSQVRRFKALGAEVILFTPTLTDERVSSFFSPMYTRKGLVLFGEVIRRIGREEGCLVLPIAEDLEAYDATLGPNELARTDGVHPFGFAQYRIAYSIIDYLNVRGTLTGRRALSASPERVPVSVKRVNKFLHEAGEKVALEFSSFEAITFKVRWSLAAERGSETVTLQPGEKLIWRLPATPKAYDLVLGARAQAVVDLTAGEKSSLYIIDLARTMVAKPINGEVVFDIVCHDAQSPATKMFKHSLMQFKGERTEGDYVGNVRIREHNNSELWLNGRVYDSVINSEAFWITGRDTVRMMFDFRPLERFGGLTPDRDTTMILMSPRLEPDFSMMGLAWWGPRFQYCIYSNGEKTEDGYTWKLGFAGNITDYAKFDISKLDYYGFHVSIIDCDGKAGTKLHSAMLSHFDINVEKALNQLIIIDRKSTFPHSETSTIQLFGY
jgi:hypothetical protein